MTVAAVILFLAIVSPDGNVEAKAIPRLNLEVCAGEVDAFRRGLTDFGLTLKGDRYSRCQVLLARGQPV